MKKKLAIIILTAIALLAVPALYAQHGRGGHHMGGGAHGPGMGDGGFGGPGGFAFFGHLTRLQSELGLTDQQIEQVKAVMQEVHTLNEPFRDQMHEGLKGVAQTLITNPDDIAAAQAKVDQQAAIERTMKTNMINGVSKALKILTAEQRAKLATILAEHAQRWENRGH